MDNSLNVFNFFLFNDEDLADELEGFARKARAVKTSGQSFVRKASSEIVLSNILPSEFSEGEHWHVLSSGDVDALSFASHIIKNNHVKYLAFSTWCMAIPDIEQMHEWMLDQKVDRIDAYVGEIFQGSYAREFQRLKEVIQPFGGRVCVFRNHSKIFLIETDTQHFVIESSANINTNPRCENTVVTCSAELYEHHKRYFDEIRAFNQHDFPNWSAF